MKFSFSDKLESRFLSLKTSFSYQLKEYAFVKWELKLNIEPSGILGYDYFLTELVIPILTIQNDQKVESEIQIGYNTRKKKHFLKVYESDDLAKFYREDLKVYYKELPFNQEVQRSQVFVKKIELNLTKENKTIILTI